MSEDRLVHLASYRQLPPKLQSVVKLALLHGIAGSKAVALLNLPNPRRTWESERVQAVVAAYGNPDTVEDWVARLEAVKGTDEDSQPKPLPFSPVCDTEDRCSNCGLVLCNCIGREAAALIEERRRDPDKATIDHNRAFVSEMFRVIERDGTDEDERDRLVAQHVRQLNHF